MRILNLTCFACVLSTLGLEMTMADNVEIYVEGRQTILEGDSQSNELEIQLVYGTLHFARGRGGTTINGGTAGVVFPVPDSMTIRMNGGNDVVDVTSLRVRGSSRADLSIEMGTGNNDLELRGTSVRRDVQIDNGGSGDIVVDGLRAKDLSIDGPDTDFALVQSSTLDHIGVSDIRELAVNHNDVDRAYLYFAREVRMYGNDLGFVDIRGTDRRDVIHFVDNHFRTGSALLGHGFIEGRDGNDHLWVDYNSFAGSWLTVDGGRGTETGLVRKSWWWDPLKVINFEGSR